jgi:adenine-specific DNA-methyltransferase
MEKITKDSPLSKSEDILKSNIETLKKLFPTIVKEGKIDKNELDALLSDEYENSDEYYRFTWAGKSDARREANKPSTATLRPCKEESKNWDTTENIFIEGDNLEVLKLLQKSYANQIKMIYIDPPYNTGKDFVYKDNYNDNLGNYLAITGQLDDKGNRINTNSESDGRFHSNWLNMMYSRLKIARSLLLDSGVVFISIDDNEVTNLKKLCDEIFGEDNFLAELVVIVKTEGRRYGEFAKTHEYVIVYAKDSSLVELNEIEIEGKKFQYFDNLGGFNLKELRNQNTGAFNSTNRPNLRYPFYVNQNNPDDNDLFEVSVSEKAGWKKVEAIEVDGLKSVWRWGKETADLNLNNLAARKGADNVIRIFQKYRKLTETAKTVWFDKKFISNRGTKEVQEILGKGIFDFPKPVSLINTLVEIGMDSKGMILDFFAGSGTTAHSIMHLNKKYNCNRKFICVQLPELTDEKSEAFKAGYKTISKITKERINRAGEKIKEELELVIAEEKNKKESELKLSDEEDKQISNEQILQKLDIGFKVFKLDSSNINSWDGTVESFEQNLLNSETNIKIDRTEEDVLFEVLLKYGLNLTVPIEEKTISGCKVYSVGLGALFVCLADKITTEVADGIGKWKEQLNPTSCRVLFKDNGFKDDVAKTNSIQNLKRFGINEINSL